MHDCPQETWDPGGCAPYGKRAAELLRLIAPQVAQMGDDIVNSVYGDLFSEQESPRAVGALDSTVLRQLKSQQTAHLQLLVSPDTTREVLLGRADAMGQAHALVGVANSVLERGRALYRSLLVGVGARVGLDLEQRYGLSSVVDQRLHDDAQCQTEAIDRVLGSYWRLLSGVYPAGATPWADATAQELEPLGALPGIHAALLLRLDQNGVLTVERSAGPRAQEISEVMRNPSTSVVIDPASPRGQGLVALAWRSRQPQSTPSYASDPRLHFWTEQATRLGVQSTFALPVCDESGHVVACVYLYGAYPNQFEAPWMREFGRGLQRRWEQIWQRCQSRGSFAITQELADAYRKRLFAGGVQMYLQPVFDLRSGEVTTVEALARLCMPDGQVITPAQFLPLLGHAELDRLFRLGLAQVLDWLVEQAVEFTRLGVSINLAPSTLLNPDCAGWVGKALRERGLEPRRLQIELLETQELHSEAQRHSIEQLATLGVRLSMDDLGSGYSSLERLSQLPFDVIKIDQGLLATLRSHPLRVLSLVGALIQMVHELGREAVVEGLEDEDAVEAVVLLGATAGQGFGLCRPMPLQHAAAWLRDFRPVPARKSVCTGLGALAYHWRYMRALDTPQLHTDLENCPLTNYLRRVAPKDRRIEQWHAKLHEGQDVDTAARHIRDWLLRAIAEG